MTNSKTYHILLQDANLVRFVKYHILYYNIGTKVNNFAIEQAKGFRLFILKFQYLGNIRKLFWHGHQI